LSQHSNRKIVTVKLGGSTMDDERAIRYLAEDVVYLQGKDLRFAIVHGGGKEITRRMADAGLTPKKVAGLRITDDATMEIVEEVMREANKEICSIFRSVGVVPEPISGADGLLVCERKPPVLVDDGGSKKFVDLGRVGQVVRVESHIVLEAIERGRVPIIAPIGKDKSGMTLNINADTAAGSIAGACSEGFVLLTDVDGIYIPGPNGAQLAPELRISEIQDLVAKGIIKEGMLPKTEACVHAINSGVKTAWIANGLKRYALRSVLSGQDHGTKIHG
jgi:acetylglutamate kinase